MLKSTDEAALGLIEIFDLLGSMFISAQIDRGDRRSTGKPACRFAILKHKALVS